MRSLRPVLAAATLAAAAAPATAAAQTGFEGVIAYDVTMGGMSMQITQMVKGKLIRQEIQGPMGEMVNITDTEASTITTIMPAQKAYMRVDVKALMQQYGQQADPSRQPRPDDFKATGKSDRIAGHACDHYAFAQDGTSLDVCVAQGLGFVPFISGVGQPPGVGGTDDVEEWRKRFPKGFLPLQVTVTSQGQTMMMKASAVEKKSLGGNLFVVPAGYTEMAGPPR